MLGFRGHFATKSRRYSTTLGRLRQARRDYTRRAAAAATVTRRGRLGRPGPGPVEDTTLVSGRGGSPAWAGSPSGDAALAAASAARARDD